ncbi:hypothetical protein J6590_048681 [Homalodisca vitripennis]|nr:hypothetical protein J6590_048681 [Homalodisca vitripennis]
MLNCQLIAANTLLPTQHTQHLKLSDRQAIGVRYSGLKCTGPCQLWYHAACVQLSEKNLTKMSKSEKTWICNECEIGKIPEKSPYKENSFLSKSSDQISELEDVKSKVQERETLEEPDLETSLTLAAEVGNALLHENNRLRQDIQNIHKHKSMLEANLASMEAKIEDLLANEEKYINKIEVLQEKLQDTLLELDKSKQQRIEQQHIFEDHDQTQSQLLTQYSVKISNLEKTLLKMDNEAKHLHENTVESENPKYHRIIETQTCNTTPTPALISTPLLLDITQLKKRQDEMEHRIKELTVHFDHNTLPKHVNYLINHSPYCSKQRHRLKDQTTTSFIKPKNSGRKENIFSVSLQVAKIKNTQNKELRLNKGNSHISTRTLPTTALSGESNGATTSQATSSTGGISQTPPEKLSVTALTGELSQLSTSQATSSTGGISQTPPEKLSVTALTGELSQLTTSQATSSTGGISQTPPEKLSVTALTGELSQLTTSQATSSTGGISQTPPEKLSVTALTGEPSQPTNLTEGISQTPPEKLSITALSDDEDFNIIEVEADIHFPDPSSVLDKPISQLRTSSSARCSREKPSVTATKLDPSESIEEFINKNIDCFRENQRQLTKSSDNSNKSTHFLDMGQKQKDKEKIQYKTRTFVNKKYIKPKTEKD